MKYKLLGKSGLRVSELALGTLTFGNDWGYGADKQESKKIFQRFINAGGNLIDTACNYTDGTSERFVGDFIHGKRQELVISSKYSISTNLNDPNSSGNHRKNLIQTVEGSLKRLKTDYIDILWLHAWDFTTPVEEVMRALDNLVSSGKVLYIGISDTPAWVVAQANTIASMRGWAQFVGLQIEYNLLKRTPERELIPMARAFDIGVTAWAPIAQGLLTGKYKNNHYENLAGRVNIKHEQICHRDQIIVDEVLKIARDINKTPAQVAINWIRQQEDVMIPIIGARVEEHIIDNLNSLNFMLTKDKLERLNKISQIDLGFPHEFLRSDHVRQGLFGSNFSKIAMR
jgi:aryl-alcohol dehydrogenase-like predicted oxidoreductase